MMQQTCLMKDPFMICNWLQYLVNFRHQIEFGFAHIMIIPRLYLLTESWHWNPSPQLGRSPEPRSSPERGWDWIRKDWNSPERQQLRHLRWSSQPPALQKPCHMKIMWRPYKKKCDDHGDRQWIFVREEGKVVVLERLAPPQCLHYHQRNQDSWFNENSFVVKYSKLNITNCAPMSDQDFVKERSVIRKSG